MFFSVTVGYYGLLRFVDCIVRDINSRAKALKTADTPIKASAMLTAENFEEVWPLLRRIELPNKNNAHLKLEEKALLITLEFKLD